jgi:cyclomaltodextrinase / maltogenic alpha-amylase / neopullulanase
MQKQWSTDAIFYHVYPLGALSAPQVNDFAQDPSDKLGRLLEYTEHWQRMGINSLYLGPLFEASSHGYDTADFFRVDRRLGDNQALRRLVQALHQRGFRVILDAVFHHVGRDFWAFRDLLANGPNSRYQGWFSGVRFGESTPYRDSFCYDPWQGHYELVKLNLEHPEVRDHLLHATQQWIEEFEIDGLRLDVAESIAPSFLRLLAEKTRALRPDFWLMGEMIHGDYRRLVNPGMLHSVTNYELYKSLWSSLNDKNLFELAHTLKRQFATGGIYQDQRLYSFVDNHDVTRAASILKNHEHLQLLYMLLFTVPGVPSVYYGSEWAFTGVKTNQDFALRPTLPDTSQFASMPQDLVEHIGRLSWLRKNSCALREGGYRELKVRPERLAFLREHPDEQLLIVVNAANIPERFEVPGIANGVWLDLLHLGERLEAKNGKISLALAPCGGRVLRRLS